MEKGEAEIEALKKLCGESKQKGKITGEYLTRLTAVFGQRFLKAWKNTKDSRVKKYTFEPSGRVVWIVVGRKRDTTIVRAGSMKTK